ISSKAVHCTEDDIDTALCIINSLTCFFAMSPTQSTAAFKLRRPLIERILNELRLLANVPCVRPHVIRCVTELEHVVAKWIVELLEPIRKLLSIHSLKDSPEVVLEDLK
ncbi:unnamed protein product, partial [Dicrocoelium dendriticum]